MGEDTWGDIQTGLFPQCHSCRQYMVFVEDEDGDDYDYLCPDCDAEEIRLREGGA